MKTDWKSWLDAGWSFFYPEVCAYCRKMRACAADGYICVSCRELVIPIQPPFCSRCGLPYSGDLSGTFTCSNCRELDLKLSHARSAVAARGMMLELIHRFKYNRALWLEPFLTQTFVAAAAPQLSAADWDALVPVPLHPAKRREREFNQAECLAHSLAAATRIPVCENALKRVTFTRTQTHLTRRGRAANVRQAFAATTDTSQLRGQRVVLIDDVLTTGATTSSCARVLLANGAERVCAWTLARGLMD